MFKDSATPYHTLPWHATPYHTILRHTTRRHARPDQTTPHHTITISCVVRHTIRHLAAGATMCCGVLRHAKLYHSTLCPTSRCAAPRYAMLRHAILPHVMLHGTQAYSGMESVCQCLASHVTKLRQSLRHHFTARYETRCHGYYAVSRARSSFEAVTGKAHAGAPSRNMQSRCTEIGAIRMGGRRSRH